MSELVEAVEQRRMRGATVDYVINHLRDGIFQGQYAPGQRLVEADLTRELGISRGPLREALHRLAADKLLEIVPGAIADAEAKLAEASDTRQHLDLVADLVDGFETPFGLELLSTVHWVSRYEGAETVDAVIAAAYSWNDRKRRFSHDQLALAHSVLQRKGWLEARTA